MNRKKLAIGSVSIAMIACLLSELLGATSVGRAFIDSCDDLFYVAFYRHRPLEDQKQSQVVIVTVDDHSLAAIDKTCRIEWPWPRECWGHIATYLDHCGARAIIFDMMFDQPSVYEPFGGDDEAFASLVAKLNTPIVFGSFVFSDGTWDHFAPPARQPTFGAINLPSQLICSSYDPQIRGKPSLAVASLTAVGIKPLISPTTPFLLHYYGPYRRADGTHTFQYVSAAELLLDALRKNNAAEENVAGAWKDLFRGKIILIGADAIGLSDLKATPLENRYPGVEIHATAVSNLLAGQEVRILGPPYRLAVSFAGALIATALVVFIRPILIRVLGPFVSIGIIVVSTMMLFMMHDIYWIAPVKSLIATIIATIGATIFRHYATP